MAIWSFAMKYIVYILTNKTNQVLYVGVTNNIKRRLLEHKLGANEGFTKKYSVNKLVYFEEFSCVDDAILREKVLKKWAREKKKRLIELLDPKWEDLSKGFM